MTEKRTAVVIDDDRLLSEAFAMALMLAGFEVTTINDPREAMAHIRATAPTLITLDMEMPRINGAALLREIRADADLRASKVIVISASSQSISDGAFDEADMVLMKPVTVGQVMDMARRLAG